MTLLMATATTLPRPDGETEALRAELARLGVAAEAHAWDAGPDCAPDWAAADMVLLRSTWNYTAALPAFEAWLERCGARLMNPLPLVRWNLRKHYLLELAARGVAMPPTRLIRQGAAWRPALADAGPDGRVVVKPAVGAGARGAWRGRADDAALAAHMAEWLPQGDMLAQPYLPRIAEGETSLIHFDGAFSHAVLKRPAAADWRVQGQHGGVTTAHEPTAAERALAETALAAAADASGTGAPLYARADMVAGADGPLLMELELIEPELFLPLGAGSAARFARAVAARL